MDKLKEYFSTDGDGFLPLSKKALLLLIRQVNNHNGATLYTYLLLKAAYKDDFIVDGMKIDKGRVKLDIEELMEFMKCGRSKVYLMLNELKRQGLVVRKDRQSLYFLPYYEKHCSGKSTKTKRNVARIQQPEDEDCFQDSDFDTFFEYYHYNLELPKSERMKAWKEWQKLNEEEKEEAMRNVSEYNRSLRKKEHAKLACNYLKDKTYKIKE